MPEVAGDIGQAIGRGITDLVEHLLTDGERSDEPTSCLRFGEDEAAIIAAFDDGKAHVVPAGHLVPVGCDAAGDLRAAFDEMAGKASRREAVIVVRRPAEGMHERAKGDGRIDAAAGDDDVGACFERRGDGARAR